MIYCKVERCPRGLKEALCCIYCTKNKNCPNACKSTNSACNLSFEVKKEPFAEGQK
ncbi:hypothetical protein [Clostridium sp. AWRP]|uniref:hypothetical protein n=1 Tax=Clostridium sp. AWRP TaxID=2212991 RepID=UPI0015865C2B|nr:hypothetical protein [Clostridium sp. AWRP]